MAEEAEDTRRFFYPIIFIPLIGEESVEAQAKSGNRIAQAIKDLHNDEFLLGWSDAGTPAYQNRVNDIAKAIHGQFVSKSGAKSGARQYASDRSRRRLEAKLVFSSRTNWLCCSLRDFGGRHHVWSATSADTAHVQPWLGAD